MICGAAFGLGKGLLFDDFYSNNANENKKEQAIITTYVKKRILGGMAFSCS